MPELAGLKNEDLCGMVRGTIEGAEANVSLLVSGRIMIYFFLDKEEHCVGHWIQEVAYTP
jgi:hypothetical protein